MRSCIICGEVFDEGSFPNKKRKTCSVICFRKYMSNIQRGKLNSNWKGGHSQSHYQRVRIETKEQKCASCGRTDCRLDTHHLDRNKANNSFENIVVLCASCHAFLHYVEDEHRGLNGWNAGKQQELKDRARTNIT